ncbi:DUF2309 domain-containing protein [Nitrosovibrio tenuis]|uniref:Probable inorganic carbon transporter subunit DabA n=1 Tax=Nitrosovibrio tenuis TaxID=1233 RepID=A0A1H7H2N4_9PROT|nr:DUF2309 domain-containing protein [Nitrosovibrio tenuis]SEK44017.1 hypothetical protein SAMN05216387_101442 [Nitrosovibrio tenuis]
MPEAHLKSSHPVADIREHITQALNHLDHVLPGQAPILDFVHHNTLHGFQHLPFEKALAEFEKLTGISGYLPETQNRAFYGQGRINDDDISAALAHDAALQAEQIICKVKDRVLTRGDVYRVALLFDLQSLTVSQLNWQIEELNALDSVQADVPLKVHKQLFADSTSPESVIRELWEGILKKLGMRQAGLHPENLLDLSLEQAEEWLEHVHERSQGASVHQQMQQQANRALDELLGQLGDSITLRGLIMALSGTDVLDSIRPQLIRICASCMDEGIAAWQMPERSRLGVYGAWRAVVQYDADPFLHELPDWQEIIAELPADAVDTIILQLTRLEIPQAKWEGYLRRLALELPGWSGLINWRQHHPNYYAVEDARPNLADYLAIRLTLDRFWLNRICHENWRVEARLSGLQTYFRKNLSEFLVRSQLYKRRLPEYLTERVASLILLAGSERHERADWQRVADLIQTWQFSPLAESQDTEHTIYSSGWRLFRLCQHLGLNASHVQELEKSDLLQMLALLDQFSPAERGKVWLYAYERHYREAFFQAIRANHNHGTWAQRDRRPDSQVVFCIDDREEGFRRHLEELNSTIETLGAAGFFGVPMNYKGLDDTRVTPLCPIVVTPAHEVREIPRPKTDETFLRHNDGRRLAQRAANLMYQSLRRNLLLSQPLIDAIAPVTLAGLLAKTLLPKRQQTVLASIRQGVSPAVDTQLMFTSTDTATIATPDHPKLGFTDKEQADRVAGFLRNTGLTYGFSEIVVLMGHGSISQNNPHLAAYDCGACSGRHGGPNARLFAAMANRPEIRKLVAERGINIPSDTWFIGAEHNTCNEEITWYDIGDVPGERKAALTKLTGELRHAQQMSAHERCRRLASAPRNPTPEQALKHIEERATDFSQARPELGHATNAAAVVGRRSVTQGAFFDRRVFLISYDPTQDPEGKVVEGILLAVGPVGAGINLEYYFSTVNNERFGCGTKVPHNVVGMFAVMEGAASDLRTGLPRQMIEIHEAVRLQILVEARTSILEQIYGRQESLRELISGGWILLSAKDPDTGEIFIFERGIGFVPWRAEARDLPSHKNSPDYYRSQTLPLPPALIRQSRPEGT